MQDAAVHETLVNLSALHKKTILLLDRQWIIMTHKPQIGKYAHKQMKSTKRMHLCTSCQTQTHKHTHTHSHSLSKTLIFLLTYSFYDPQHSCMFSPRSAVTQARRCQLLLLLQAGDWAACYCTAGAPHLGQVPQLLHCLTNQWRTSAKWLRQIVFVNMREEEEEKSPQGSGRERCNLRRSSPPPDFTPGHRCHLCE